MLLCTGAYTLLANALLAQLHHHNGRRHIYYRGLAKEIMGGCLHPMLRNYECVDDLISQIWRLAVGAACSLLPS